MGGFIRNTFTFLGLTPNFSAIFVCHLLPSVHQAIRYEYEALKRQDERVAELDQQPPGKTTTFMS